MILSRQAVRAIRDAVGNVFARVRARMFGVARGPKQIRFGLPSGRQDLTLGAVFDQAAVSEGFRPNPQLRAAALRAASGYLDAHQKRAETEAVEAVEAFLTDAERKKVKTNLDTVLGGHVSELFGRVRRDVERVADTEATKMRNLGGLDGSIKLAHSLGVDDPRMFFVIVRDGHCCAECERLHMFDEVTPRVWKLSEIGSGYHRRGDENPKMSGLHPRCRCQRTAILPGYGFDSAGFVTFVEPGFDVLAQQRGG